MPPKKCCKKCVNKQEPYVCFKKGVGVGIGIGMTRQRNIKKSLIDMSLRELGTQASRLGISGYSKMNKATLQTALRNAGY